MVHISIFPVVAFAAIFLPSATALPTLLGHPVVLASRHTCPALTKLPIHWNPDAADEGVKVALSETRARSSVACMYTVIGGWQKKPARAIIPMPGLNEQGMDLYNKPLLIADKLGKVLAKTEVDGVSAVILDMTPPTGNVFYKTTAWINFFGQTSRKAPSTKSYEECRNFIRKTYDDVTNTVVWYAEKKGMLYDVELGGFSFESSVLWSDDMKTLELVNWDPKRTTLRQPGVLVTESQRHDWRMAIATNDLRIIETIYVNSLTHESRDVRGWCEYFKVGASRDQVFSYGRTDGL